MKEGLEKVLKKSWKIFLLGVAIKMGTVVLQSDTQSSAYGEFVQENPQQEIYNSDTTNLKRDYLFYNLCKED